MKVQLKVYDLSRGMASTIGSIIMGMTVDGVWHTGILVDNIEYFYGDGISKLPNGEFETSTQLQPSEIINLGETTKTKQEFENFLSETLSHKFTSENYHVLNWNCNHFTQECAKFLVGKEIPSRILHQAEVFKSNPRTAKIMQFIEAALPQNQVHATPIRQAQSSESAVHEDDQQFSKQLKKLSSSISSESFQDIISILVATCKNILSEATNSELRILNLSSNDKYKKILEQPIAIECLKHLGFQEEHHPNGVYYRFPEPTADILRDLLRRSRLLISFMKNARDQDSNSPQAPVTQESSPQERLPSDVFHNQIKLLETMGFTDSEQNLNILRQVGGNLNQALDHLMK